MPVNRWTKEQTKLAFYLYCQLPFGQLHQRNKDIVELAMLIDRTPSAVAMKMCNLASLDPAIINSGRSGLGNASGLDKEVWDEFHADWDGLASECAAIKYALGEEAHIGSAQPIIESEDLPFQPEDYSGETKKVLTEQRVKQSFFRRAVLSGYGGKCCISNLSDCRLLVASHIVPWSQDKSNRLNPSNGLCLSAIHDKAFDRGLISLTDDMKVLLSSDIKAQQSDFHHAVFSSVEGKRIAMPEKFMPDILFIRYHRESVFLG